MARNSSSREYSFDGLPGYTISVSNVPENITPRLIPIPPEEDTRLKSLTRDGTIRFITSVAGNLIFEDEEGRQVDHFLSPIRLTYNFTEEDEKKRQDREKVLNDKRRKEEGEGAEYVTVRLIPIFLYQLDPEKTGKPSFEVWMPFQNYDFDEKQQIITIDFLFWGDRQVGGGTQP